MQTKIYKNDILGEEYSLTILDNKLRVYILQKPDYQTTYAIYGTKYGSIDTAFSVDSGDMITVPEGIAHFLEHKLFESEDGDAFTKYAATGGYANAFTSFDKTCYLFSCSKMFDENMDILLDFVQKPYFTEATVKKEQGIIGQEIRMYDDSPGWCVLFNALSAMYHNNPVKIDIAGTTDSIAKIDSKLLYDCYNAFYNPANMFICVVGNVDREKCLNKIALAVNKKEEHIIHRNKVEEPETIVTDYIEKKLDVALPLFCGAFKQNIKSEVTLYDVICVNILLNIIVGDASPLYKKLVDFNLINDSFDTEYFVGRDYAAILFEGESQNPKEVMNLIKEEIANLKISGLNKQLLEAAKKDSYGSMIKRYNSVEDIAMMFVDAAVSDYNPFDEVEIIKNLSVKDVEKYLDIFENDKSVLSVILPR